MHPSLADMPATLPIFPLKGVLLLPGGRLPLNIFEPRYLAMVDDSLKGNRLIGMIQPKSPCRDGAEPNVYPVGCAGRIVSFAEQDDGRYEIVLGGISRFTVIQEVDGRHGYRCVAAEWQSYSDDLQETMAPPLDRARLIKLLHAYFSVHQLSADWETIKKTSNRHLITCLAMICPFSVSEKQALLEAPDPMARATVMMQFMEMAIASQPDCGKAH